MIERTAGRRDDQLHPFPKRLDLRFVADAAVHGGGSKAAAHPQHLGVRLDLARQLAGRHEDERLCPIGRGVQALQHR